MIRLYCALALCTALLVAACAARPLQPGPATDVLSEGLQRMTGTSFGEVWVRPGVTFSSYRAVALGPTQVSYREVDERLPLDSPRMRSGQDAFPIPAAQRARIEQGFEERLAEALDRSRHFSRAPVPEAGALTLHAELVDLVSRVPAEGAIGWTEVYVSSVGEATLIVELRDSESGDLLARAIDFRRAGPRHQRLIRANQVTSWAEIDLQMQRWAREVRSLLEELWELGPT